MNDQIVTIILSLIGAGAIAASTTIGTLTIQTWAKRREAGDKSEERHDGAELSTVDRLWIELDNLKRQNEALDARRESETTSLRSEISVLRDRVAEAERKAILAEANHTSALRMYTDLHDAFSRLTSAYDDLKLQHRAVMDEYQALRTKLQLPQPENGGS